MESGTDHTRNADPHPSQHRFEAVTQSIDDAVIAGDAESRIVFWNRGAQKVFGWTEEEAIGSPLTMLMPERFHEAHLAGMRRVLDGGEPRVIGHTVRLAALRSDGTEFPVELTLGRWSGEDTDCFTGVVHDVSERERSERYLATQLAVTGILVEAETDDPGVIPRLLSTFARSMGWQVGELWLLDEAAGVLRLDSAWHQAEHATRAFREASAALAPARGEGLAGTVWATGAPLHVPDFAADSRLLRQAEAAAVGLKGAIGLPVLAAGEVSGVLTFYSGDVGQFDEGLVVMMETLSRQLGLFFRRTRAERALAAATAELQEHAEELERSNADLEQFAYIASHDLSEPLRTISGFVQLLSSRYRGELDEQADQFIAYVVDGTERMRALIDGLLLYSRASSQEQHRRPVSLVETVARVRSSLGPALEESGGHILEEELPDVVADPTQLEQILQNLIANALKFRGEHPPEVRVLAARQPGAWRVTVRDNGIGIEDRHAEKAFQMFGRLNAREAYPGTGIGLALCKRVVERHGGRIWLESEPGRGSAFHFTLADAGAEAAA